MAFATFGPASSTVSFKQKRQAALLALSWLMGIDHIWLLDKVERFAGMSRLAVHLVFYPFR